VKEEIARIMRLVQEGKLSPEDAAELIDAFTATERSEAEEPQGETPPPPPPPPPGHDKDPFRSFCETMENIGKEVSHSVNWKEVAAQIRTGAQKGVETIREGIKSGKFNIGWFSAQEVREITMPLTFGEGKLLRIENPCGSVRIAGGFEDSSLSAKAHVRGADEEDARSKAEAYTIIVEESEHQVLIRQPDVTGLSVDLVIQLAQTSAVEVRTQDGNVSVYETGSSAKINTQSGDVHLRGLNGAIEVHVQSGDLVVEDSRTPSLSIENKAGDIKIVGVHGNMNARTASGDVKVRRCSGKSVAIESVSGDVSVDLEEPISGSVSIRTVNGDAALSISDMCDCRVSLSTLRGEVSSSVELQDEARLEQRITGRLGEGTGTIDVSGINGDIALRLRDATGEE
jgi:hypothetical protein